MERKLLGHISVDGGLCWVGDPCYILGHDASHKVESWKDFCHKITDMEASAAPLGEGTGIVTSTGYGDGSYPVYGYLTSGGRVAKIEVEFINLDDSEEGQW